MANQATGSCSRFTAVFSLVFLCFLAHVWVATDEEECLNGGITLPSGVCSCPEGYDGPMCELWSIGFDGNGFAVYPPIAQYNSTRIRLEVAPEKDTGLILYVGPYEFDRRYPEQDFLALELLWGFPVLVVDYGPGNTFVLESKHCTEEVPQPGKPFSVELVLEQMMIEMIINDKCRLVSTVAPLHRVRFDNPGFLNREDPLLLGGTGADGKHLTYTHDWTFEPQTKGFSGCIRNLTVNGRPIDLGLSNKWMLVRPSCRRPKPPAIDLSFLIWLIVFILGIFFLYMAVLLSDALYYPHEQDEAREIQQVWGQDDAIEMLEIDGGESDAVELRQPTVAEEEMPDPTSIESIMEPFP